MPINCSIARDDTTSVQIRRIEKDEVTVDRNTKDIILLVNKHFYDFIHFGTVANMSKDVEFQDVVYTVKVNSHSGRFCLIH